MPKKCGECSIFYTDKLTENKTIKCTMCNIGHHGCVKRTETEIKGWKWICEECESIFAENDDELLENLRAWVSLATIHITKKDYKNQKKEKGCQNALRRTNKKKMRVIHVESVRGASINT